MNDKANNEDSPRKIVRNALLILAAYIALLAGIKTGYNYLIGSKRQPESTPSKLETELSDEKLKNIEHLLHPENTLTINTPNNVGYPTKPNY